MAVSTTEYAQRFFDAIERGLKTGCKVKIGSVEFDAIMSNVVGGDDKQIFNEFGDNSSAVTWDLRSGNFYVLNNEPNESEQLVTISDFYIDE